MTLSVKCSRMPSLSPHVVFGLAKSICHERPYQGAKVPAQTLVSQGTHKPLHPYKAEIHGVEQQTNNTNIKRKRNEKHHSIVLSVLWVCHHLSQPLHIYHPQCSDQPCNAKTLSVQQIINKQLWSGITSYFLFYIMSLFTKDHSTVFHYLYYESNN